LCLRGPNDDKHYSDLLQYCDQLSTLHINLPEGLFTPVLQQSLTRLGPSSDTLTLQEQGLEGISFRRGVSLDAAKVFQSCSNLRFLGHQLDCEVFQRPRGLDFIDASKTLGRTFISSLISTVTYEQPIDIRQDNFYHLSNLRIVQFRYLRLRAYDTEEEDKPQPAEISAHIQRFATTVFTHMYQTDHRPTLRGIIFGMDWDPECSHSFNADGEYPYTRHCFVKGIQIDALGRKMIVAFPVPAHRIRELEPDCDLLDFDPECG
jgi:hypothetical protein